MGTRAFVGNLADMKYGSIAGCYIHWDGYIETVGTILQEAWGTKERLKQLFELGDMSSLGHFLEPVGTHSFEKPEKDVCVFYHRDCGENLNNSTIRFSEDKNYVLTPEYCDLEFYYLFEEGSGFRVYGRSGQFLQLLPVEGPKDALEPDVASMTRAELEAELTFLRQYKNWGFMPDDFALMLSDLEEAKTAVPYPLEELSDRDMLLKLKEAMSQIYSIEEFDNTIERWGQDNCSDEDWRLIATLTARGAEAMEEETV